VRLPKPLQKASDEHAGETNYPRQDKRGSVAGGGRVKKAQKLVSITGRGQKSRTSLHQSIGTF